MNLEIAQTADRAAQVEQVSGHLVRRASLLVRLLTRQLDMELSRTEAGLLGTLSNGPQRITSLAELEGLAQPTMTLMVKRLEQQGLVKRGSQADDGRVVLVSLTGDGAAAVVNYRERASQTLREYLAGMTDAQVQGLADATEALDSLIGLLQGEAAEARA